MNTLNPRWNDFLFDAHELNGNDKELKLMFQINDGKRSKPAGYLIVNSYKEHGAAQGPPGAPGVPGGGYQGGYGGAPNPSYPAQPGPGYPSGGYP